MKLADRKWKAEYFLDNQLDLGRCSFYNWQYPLTVCQMEKVHKFCICGEPFGYIETAAALEPTKNKQVGCQGNFYGYLPDGPAKTMKKPFEELKNSIRKPATGQSWHRQTYPPNRAAHVAIDTIENFTYEKWVSLPNLLVIQIVQC